MYYRRYLLLYLYLSCQLFAHSQIKSYISPEDSLFNEGMYAESLNEHLKHLTTLQSKNDYLAISYSHYKIGRSYYYLNNRKTAIDWFRTSIDYARKVNADSIIAKNLRNIGSVYIEMALKDSALIYLSKARPMILKLKNDKESSLLYALYFELKLRLFNDTLGSEPYLDTCALYSKKEGDANTYGFYLIKRGIFYRNTRRPRLAIQFLNEAKKTYESINQLEGQMYALICLSSTYRDFKDADSCYLNYMYYTDLRDKVYKDKTAENAAKYETLFNTKTKEIENLDLKRKNQLLFWFIVLGIILAGVISFTIYKIKANNKQRKFNEQLKEEQRKRFLEVLQTQENERSRIASDLHDGVGHLLSAIKLNLSALSAENNNDKSITDNLGKMVDSASLEVRQISHELMPQSLTELNIISALNELANRINKSNSITVIVSSQNEITDISKKTQIVVYRIIQEILNNILKHAKASAVDINLTHSESKLFLVIQDNGIYFDENAIKNSDGIGWKNIRARIEMFNGEYSISSNTSGGTKISVSLNPEV